MRALILALLLLIPGLARAQEPLRVWVFGNSLVHHLTDSDATTVPHWLARMARAEGRPLALDGAWGFLGDFADLPPEPGWTFAEVPRAWEGRAFGMVPWDAVILTPPNFIQGEPPDAEVMDGDALTPSARILDWTASQTGARLLVFQGWPEMESRVGFPPSKAGLAEWNAWALGGYDAWFADYVARLEGETGLEIGLIPVARVTATLLGEAPLDAAPPEALFSDGAPHGTATAYLLAAMVTHAVLWGEAPPRPEMGEEIDPALRDNYGAVAARVAALVGAAPRAEAEPVVAPASEAAWMPEPAPADPSVGINLAGIADWSTEMPFLDLMRTARPWIGHEGAAWGAWDEARLREGGWVGADGWPLAMPPGVDRLESFVLTDQPEAGRWLAGRYVLTWEGAAAVELGGRATDVRREGERRISFAFEPGAGPVGVAVTALDAGDPLRAMSLVREEALPLWQAGALFEPRFLERARGFRVLRLMDWMDTNGSEQVAWEDRPRVSDFTWAARGVPVEVMVRLANEAGADPWFTLPHQADDGYVAAFAAIVHGNLDPRLRAHAEWSNEVWNWIFPQAAWADAQARARWGEGAPEDAWMQWAGLRAAEVADLWARAFADDPARLVRVAAVHTGWPGLEDAMLDAPLAVAEGRAAPAGSFDAYAVTGYLGHALGSEEGAPALRAAMADGTAGAHAAAVAQADLDDLADRLWPHHFEAARARGLRLLAYEAGLHAAPQGAVTEDEAVAAFLSDWSYSAEAGALQAALIERFEAAGGTLMAPFVDVAPPSRWGSWGALRHLDDATVRWEAIRAANARPPAWDEGRDLGAFADGTVVGGTEGPDRLAGTPEEDVVLAGPGDDEVAVEGADVVDGGEGRDLALLPGAASDWAVAREGGALVLTRGWVAVRLSGVEEVRFAAGGAIEGAP